MNFMFNRFQIILITWNVIIPQTNGGSINNTTSRLYGKTTSIYASPAGGKSFTLASN